MAGIQIVDEETKMTETFNPKKWVEAHKLFTESGVQFTGKHNEDNNDILRRCIKSGLRGYLDCAPSNIYEEEVVEFFAKVVHRGEYIESYVGDHRVKITRKLLKDEFDLPDGKIKVSSYMEGREKKYIELFFGGTIKAKDVDNAKKGMLSDKFKVLMDIAGKIMMGQSFSADALTYQKVRVMVAIFDQIDVDWQGFFFERIVVENLLRPKFENS